MVQCDICGRVLDENQNRYNIIDEKNTLMIMCGLHAETSKIVAIDRKIDTSRMRIATLRLNNLRPSLKYEPEKWIDWDPLNTLISLYKNLPEDNSSIISDNDISIPISPISLDITIPGDKTRIIHDNKYIEKELLGILSYCTGKSLITSEPISEVLYDEFSNPKERRAQYGNNDYGIFIKATPIFSGIGIHGEEATWKLIGLPPGIIIIAKTRMDLRGGDNNFYSLYINRKQKSLENIVEYIKSIFAQDIKNINSIE